MNSPIKVLLVEDDPYWQTGVKTLLEKNSRFQVASIVDEYESALSAFKIHHHQLALLDWQICGEKDGLDIGHRLIEFGLPSHQIILISAANPQSIPSHPFLYIPKNQLAEDLLPLLGNLFPAGI